MGDTVWEIKQETVWDTLCEAVVWDFLLDETGFEIDRIQKKQ